MKKIIIMLCFSVLLFIFGCTSKSGVANPASVFCEENGGVLEIVSGPDGQKGVCMFGNGIKCEEWAYYRGECTKDYDAAEVLIDACTADQDCATPMEYLVRSNCPYTTKCLKDKCTVVCPKFDGEKYPDVKDCGKCPEIMPPSPNFCKSGTIVTGEVDECGCSLPPRCVV